MRYVQGVLALALLSSSLTHAQPVAHLDRVARLIEQGDARRAAGDTISALGLYRDAVSAAPRRSEGYVALGELYMALSEPARALEVFEVGTRSARKDEALWLGLARTLLSLGLEQRALEALRSLRSDALASRDGLRALAEAAEARGAFLEALSVRRALLELPGGDDERARVRALERLVGRAERVRGHEACGDGEPSPVLRALARCP